MVGTDMSTGARRFDPKQGGPVQCLIDPLMVIRARTFKSHHTVRRRASVRSCYAHVTVKRCNDGKPTLRNHPTTVTTIQPPKQRRGRTDGTNYTQRDQSVKIPD